MTPDISQAAIEERYRLEARLRSNPDFRCLEAVRRVIALYAPGAEVPATVDPISCHEPTESTIRSAPMPNSDLSLTIASSDPLTSPDPPVSSRRGSWWYTNSKESRMRAAAAEYLQKIGRRAKGTEICEALLSKGIEIGGRKPSTTLSGNLSSSPIFDHIPGEVTV
jgi:hypothetical protein